MKFKSAILYSSGEQHPSRWHSECGKYAISMYQYDHDGNLVRPYYVAYRRSDGVRLTPDDTSMTSFDDVVSRVEKYASEVDNA